MKGNAHKLVAGLLGIGVVITAQAQIDPEILHIHALTDNGQAQAAESEAREYLKLHPERMEAHFALGYTLFRQRKAIESLAEYTSGARLGQPSASDLTVVGSDYVLLEDYPDADKWFSKALEWDPKNLQIVYYLGRTKYNENRFDEAVALFQQCLQADPHSVKAKDNLGLSYQGLGKWEEAEAAYRQAIALEQGAEHRDPGPYLNLGSMLVDNERAAEGIEYLRTALAIDNKEVRAHRTLGKAYLRLGRLEEAQSELEISVRMQPDYAATHFVLSQLYRRRGMLEQAKAETEQYMKLSGNKKLPESR